MKPEHRVEARSSANESIEMARRFVVIVALGFWLGGFTFYAGVVIHTGHRVFGSARETGFLTQQVTHWLNLSGVVAMAVLLWNALAARGGSSTWRKWILWLTLALMVAIQFALYALHPVLDGMLDTQTHRILEKAKFYRWHQAYMNLSTLQWVAGLAHTFVALLIWRTHDTREGRVRASVDERSAYPNLSL